MCSAPLSPSAKTAIRARRAAVRSCALAMAFASDGDGEGEAAKGASFFATALADVDSDLPRVIIASLRGSII